MPVHATPVLLATLVLLPAAALAPTSARAGTTVECHSVDYRYAECRAPLKAASKPCRSSACFKACVFITSV